jgi:Cys-tRNA(Pro)/Cys-tRNA(Cys) deacylase
VTATGAAHHPKTNAIRILEQRGVAFEVLSYEYDEETSGAVVAAEKLGLSPDRVFKTLVTAAGEGAHAVFCIPGNATLDRKKAAAASGHRRIELVAVKDLFELTGYLRGGCSPIGLKKPFPVFVDEIATVFDWILVNAGARGLQARLDPRSLVDVVGARFADLV